MKWMLLAIASCAILSAHDFSQSESTLAIDGSIVSVRLRLNLLEIPDVDTSRNGVVSYEELDASIERVFAAIKQHFVLGAPDVPAGIVAERHEIVADHVLQIDLRYEFAHGVTRLDVTSTLDELMGPTHQHFATARIDGETVRAVLDAGTRRAQFDRSRITLWRLAAVLAAVVGLVMIGWLRSRR